jgi:ribose/xylose/arabinose/galactoside ABC-type transport system permease subunit
VSNLLSSLGENVKNLASRMGFLILILGIFGSMNSAFISTASFRAVFQGLVFVGIAAIFLTILITSGEFDISVGANAALSGTIAAYFVVRGNHEPWNGQSSTYLPDGDHKSPFLGLFIGIAVGAVIGLLNAAIVLVGKVPSFIATIGMLFIAKSLATYIPGGKPVSGYLDHARASNPSFYDSFFIRNFSIILFLVLLVIGHIILKKINFGRVVAAIGSNKEAARTSGVQVTKVKALLFVLTGAGAGLAGAVSVFHFGAIYFSLGSGWELTAIAAIVLGGTSLFGGRGTIIGLLYGLFLMQTIASGMVAVGVDPWWQTVITGGIVLVTLVIERLRGKE